MIKDAVIKINSEMESDGTVENVSLTSDAKISEKNGNIYIMYEEGESIGFNNVSTTIKIAKDGTVSLTRRGGMESRLILESGQRHLCHYNTGFADFMVGIYTNELRVNMSEAGGDLFMSYNVDVNSQLVSQNKINITATIQ